ncbi:MAG: site-2 protease family protein [Bryobacteraceae bacterium]
MSLENAFWNVALFWGLTAPHEFAHAWAATRLGDDTPRRQGRLSLNPLAHVDWLGTVLLPALTSLSGYGFLGWGRAVLTDPAALRGGWGGLALVALAGPAMNVVMAVLLGAGAALTATTAPLVSALAVKGMWLSLYLALFNLMPVPPLDGSKFLLAARVPPTLYEQASRYGFLLLILAMSAGDLGRWLSEGSWRGTRLILNWFA